jgi:hypothetical protein
MASAEELSALRKAYEDALIEYANASGVLNRHALRRTNPTRKELQREADARVILEAARSRYLESWMLP